MGLGKRLREDGNYDLALHTLDGAVVLDASEDVTRAAYTCAIAIHADKGDLRLAARLGAEQLAKGESEQLLTVMARVYWELWQETDEPTWRVRWRRIADLIDDVPATV